MKKILSTLILFTALGCNNRVIVQKVSTGDRLDGKLFYALPANTLEFEIKIKKQLYKRGQFYVANLDPRCDDYINVAVNSLGLDKTALDELKSKADYAVYSVEEDEIKLTEGAIADASKVFVFKNEPKFYKDNSLALAFNSDWLVSQGTIATENKTVEIVTTFVSTALSVAASLAKSGSVIDPNQAISSLCGEKLKKLMKMKADYEKILISPPANLNAEALATSKAAHLKQIEKEVEALYYSKTESVKIIRFSVLLSDEFLGNQGNALFKLDEVSGKLLFSKTLSPKLLWPRNSLQIVETDLKATGADAGAYWLSVTPDTQTILSVVNSQSLPVLTTGVNYGIAYNVPRNMKISLGIPNSEPVKSVRFPVAQFGFVNTLNPMLTKADFTLDSLTGRLVKVTIESKASLTTDRIKTGGALLPQTDSTFKKKAKPTAIEQIEEEVKEKELRVKLKELNEKLN